MKFNRLALLSVSVIVLGMTVISEYSVQANQTEGTEYTIQDVRLLQDFLVAKSTETDLTGKAYDLNSDGRWNVFDLCLMKRRILQGSLLSVKTGCKFRQRYLDES